MIIILPCHRIKKRRNPITNRHTHQKAVNDQNYEGVSESKAHQSIGSEKPDVKTERLHTEVDLPYEGAVMYM